ncbi:MAG: c-type cytochrome, partial [Pseudomonadota bacterium]
VPALAIELSPETWDAAVEGKTVLGLPNVALDLASLYEDVVKTVILLHGDRPGNPPFPLGLVSGSPDPAPANVVFPEGLFSITRGATNAFGFSVHWLMWRNEDMELVQTPYDLRPMEHYLDTPPWWHTMKKALFYYDGFTTKTHKAMMQVSLDPSIGPAQLMGFEDDYAEIYEWLHTLSPPAYQGPVNARRATAGADVYASNCAQCHGQPGPGGEYHDRMSPIDEVQTDRGRLDGLSPQFRAHYKRSWLGDYSNAAITVRPVGYVAPPLDGIWASAPYLHNGSVPTLYHLLFADERPPVWRVRDYDRYDHDQLGLVVDSFEAMPSTASRFEKRRFYDTSQPTLGNEGHRFADELSREERYQLLEYLKTL